ncbi:MAG: hypothetical protein FWG60_02855 [Methanomassiliicoccaceae archaeon]|nr:hypothetical protein [Methanomassiliicoccaceae archaeon]
MNKDKIIGALGIAAVIVFLLSLIAAIVMSDDFVFGSGALSDLFPEQAFVAGCVVAGIIGALFGLLITLGKEESKVFIGKIRGVLMILSGAALAVLGLMNGESWTVYLFIALITLAAASDIFYNWVADQKIIMVISLLLALAIALTGILSQTGENNMMGFAFIMFVSLWVILVAAMRFAPVVEKEPAGKEKKAKSKEPEKKNAPKPKPYPAKKEEPAPQKKPATEKPVYKEKAKAEEPKKEEPKKEEPKPAPAAEAKEQPKLKVMSSREAAAAREARKKEEAEEEIAAAPAAEVVQAPVAETVPEEAETYTEPEEEYDEDFEIVEDTPDALLRRATWNKGLRCRRDYGEYQIPIAYVKAKVAVYVEAEAGDTSGDEKLREDGWTVLRYLEKDITDGKDQAEEISKAVKENLRAERAAKKKKSSKK